MSTVPIEDEEDSLRPRRYKPAYSPLHGPYPIVINQRTNHDHPTPWNLLSLYSPFYAPLLFENEQSEVRDFAANERTFLSHLRLGLYLAIVAAALLISFHFKEPPTEEERKVGLPLGIVFWVLSLGACASSVALYIKHLEGYGHRRPIVQSGWVARSFFAATALIIVAVCIFFIVIEARARD